MQARKSSLTGCVIDIGDGCTHIIPVSDGYVIASAIKSIPIAGRDVTTFVQQLLRCAFSVANGIVRSAKLPRPLGLHAALGSEARVDISVIPCTAVCGGPLIGQLKQGKEGSRAGGDVFGRRTGHQGDPLLHCF